MIIKKIDEKEYDNFVKKSDQQCMHQSLGWKKYKENENKKVELVGLFEKEKLVGVSLIIYRRIFLKYQFAYASHGFIYDYSNIKEFKKALIYFFKNKRILFVKIDPLVIKNVYNTKLEEQQNKEGYNLIKRLVKNGFIANKHGLQFQYIHRLKIKNSFDMMLLDMSKSTVRNIDIAKSKGVELEQVSIDHLKESVKFIDRSLDRKEANIYNYKFYEDLVSGFIGNYKIYLVYINKEKYIEDINHHINDNNSKIKAIEEKKKTCNFGKKLKHELEIVLVKKEQLEIELEFANNMDEKTYIGTIISVNCYKETIALASGMDEQYRKFCPKYAMYPQLIKDAITEKSKYLNFLGVFDIFDENSKNFGVYEVKRGFGGETVEYIGEFDLPVKKFMYLLYKLYKKVK